MTSSFPYMQCAKQIKEPYDRVLRYADYLQRVHDEEENMLPESEPTFWEAEAASRLSEDAKRAVERVWRREHERREAVIDDRGH